ncbi:hypothetical protein QR680_009038 [Steinernema hermaphroditum]|uniref:Histone H2A n=1 Tax=Steinernema hermaphroditum TaxID=289476 RepID=A0AA39IK92_9BILA|nr:hypothetical protein QR680_009038 [Steinernema hermaphroditum]
MPSKLLTARAKLRHCLRKDDGDPRDLDDKLRASVGGIVMARGSPEPSSKTSKKKTNTESERATRVTHANRAGLLFPVGRIRRHLKSGNVAQRVGVGSAIFTAAVLEYMMAEVTELAGNLATAERKHRITPRQIMTAIRSDHELNNMFHGVTFRESGVIPHIEQAVLS